MVRTTTYAAHVGHYIPLPAMNTWSMGKEKDESSSSIVDKIVTYIDLFVLGMVINVVGSHSECGGKREGE